MICEMEPGMKLTVKDSARVFVGTILIRCVIIIILAGNMGVISCRKEKTVSSIVNPLPLPPTPPVPALIANPKLMLIDTLSNARFAIKGGAAGNKILFAGGLYGIDCFIPGGDYGDSIKSVCISNAARVDIYDTTTHTWTIHELSRYYESPNAVTAGNKIFLSGGLEVADRTVSDKVDVYDALTNTWTVIQLSEARLNVCAATLGNKVFFAGGVKMMQFQVFVVSNKVDIYDVSTNSWSVATLSEARSGISATAAGNQMLFAGGDYFGWQPVSNTIDIYDAVANTWTSSQLSEPRAGICAFTLGSEAFFVGGRTGYNSPVSRKIDVYDGKNNSWSVKEIDFFVNGAPAAVIDNKAFLFSGRTISVYKASSGSWAHATINEELGMFPAIIGTGNDIYIASGHPYPYGGNHVYKLRF
jgi:N-acetylneuraminic acid mutarotase